jgi:hypothetical protein
MGNKLGLTGTSYKKISEPRFPALGTRTSQLAQSSTDLHRQVCVLVLAKCHRLLLAHLPSSSLVLGVMQTMTLNTVLLVSLLAVGHRNDYVLSISTSIEANTHPKPELRVRYRSRSGFDRF